MGSCDDEDLLHSMADDSNEKDQAAQMTGDFQNGAGKGNGGKTTSNFKKESMENVTIGEEDHVVIRVHECESEETEAQINKTPQRKNGRVDGQFAIHDFNHSDNAGRNEKNTIQDSEAGDDLSLKGQFVVHETQNEDSGYVETDSNPRVLEKTLTLAVCSPTLSTSTCKNDSADTPILITSHHDKEPGDNEDHNDTEINEDINEEDIGLTLNSGNTDTENDIETRNVDIKSESSERSEQETVSTNNKGNEKMENRVLNRATVQPRTNMKHGKNRYKLEDAMPEIDETNDNVLDSVVRANKGTIGDRANSINPKTSWKHENKSPARNKYPIKKDLHADVSQTRNSLLNRTGSPSLKHSTTRQDVSRLNASFANDETTKLNKNALSNSFISSIPNVSYDYGGNSRHSRSSFHCTTPRDIQNNDRKGTFTSIFQRRYTKRELQKALPRKSFFNCHDRAMKDAGLEVEDPVSKRKAERLKAKLERIAKEFDPLPSKVVIETGKENNGIHSPDGHKEVSIILTDAQDPNVDDDMNSDVNENNRVNSEDMIDARVNIDSIIHTMSKKKRLHPEKNDHVECKPLVQYLEYVKDNQLEYENYRQSSVTTSSTNKPIRRLISMGKAFDLRHRGGTFKAKGDDVIVMAAKALRPRSSDASRYFKHDDKSGLRGQDPSLAALRQVRPPSDDKRRQEKNASTSNTTKDDEHHAKTELERKKIRAEEWAMSVSTNTLTKAKIQSLRELGADDEELTKWWVALRRCHYLRTNALVAESL